MKDVLARKGILNKVVVEEIKKMRARMKGS
jgi:hypothetical protein